MGPFSRLMAGGLLAAAVVLPYQASNRGYGLSSERNAKVIQEMQSACPPHLRTALGGCRTRRYRSYYRSRSHYGGGPGAGK